MLLALAEWANDDTGQCWPGRDSIAQRLRRSPRTVDRVIGALIRRGLVEIVKPAAPNRTSTYQLNVRQLVTHERESTGGARSDPTCAKSGPNVRHLGSQRETPGGAQNPQEPSVEPSDQRAREEPSQEELAAMITALRREAVRQGRAKSTIDAITEHWAAKVIKQILEDRNGSTRDVQHRVRYLVGAVQGDRDPSRFLPTPGPSRYQPERNRA